MSWRCVETLFGLFVCVMLRVLVAVVCPDNDYGVQQLIDNCNYLNALNESKNTSLSLCVCVYTHIHPHTYTHRTHTHTHAHTHTRTNMCSYTHTHMHNADKASTVLLNKLLKYNDPKVCVYRCRVLWCVMWCAVCNVWRMVCVLG